MATVLAIIPARSGSKSIPHKNIRSLAGIPLLAYSIEHAKKAELVNRIIVSTDSERYAKIANKYGAETPFLRPKEFSGDFSTDLEVFQHALNWLKDNEGYTPDFCVHLRPTHPIRNPKDIDAMLNIIIEDPELDAVRSLVAAPETPYKMWFRNDVGIITPVITTNIPEAYNAPRQKLPKTYLQNASIDVMRASTLLEKNSMTGTKIYGYVMDHLWDIDEPAQLKAARKFLKTGK